MKPLCVWPMLTFPHTALPSQLGLEPDLSQAPSLPSASAATAGSGVDVNWYPPAQTRFNDIDRALHGPGLDGLVFQDDESSVGVGEYNWCNMPRVRAEDYIHPGDGFEIVYAEVIHRHHKRTPYAANSFPVEPYQWNCDDVELYSYAHPRLRGDSTDATGGAPVRRKGYIPSSNPVTPRGWTGTCQFPQITEGGLRDSHRHGRDLGSVYGTGNLGLLRMDESAGAEFRITDNVITSEVLGMVVGGMMMNGAESTASDVDGLTQPSDIDSLKPGYSCPASDDAFEAIRDSEVWKEHLEKAQGIFDKLDEISGVEKDDWGFHSWFDHYYDNLSARQCHGKPLPCSVADSSRCITQDLADSVYRLGNWEYSRLYRDEPASLGASAASMGVWLSEVAQHLRDAMRGAGDGDGGGVVRYRHNVGHDGSIARVLSVLQIDVMLWPGMGSEVVFELWKKKDDDAAAGESDSQGGEGKYAVRVLYGGKVVRSSSPALGELDMVPVERLLGYFDELVGSGGSKVVGMCRGETPLPRRGV